MYIYTYTNREIIVRIDVKILFITCCPNTWNMLFDNPEHLIQTHGAKALAQRASSVPGSLNNMFGVFEQNVFELYVLGVRRIHKYERTKYILPKHNTYINMYIYVYIYIQIER